MWCSGQWNISEDARHHFQVGAFNCQSLTAQHPPTSIMILEAHGEMTPLSAWVPDWLQGETVNPPNPPTLDRWYKWEKTHWALKPWDLRGCLLPWTNLAYSGWSWPIFLPSGRTDLRCRNASQQLCGWEECTCFYALKLIASFPYFLWEFVSFSSFVSWCQIYFWFVFLVEPLQLLIFQGYF